MKIENPSVLRLLFPDKSPLDDYDVVATEFGYQIAMWNEASMGVPLADLPALIDTKGHQAILAEKAAEIRFICEQEILDKANPQEQEGARNRIVLAMARKQPASKADLDLLDWVEARRAQCESDVQFVLGE